MALKRCPECKKKISDTCDTCIHCGYKLRREVSEDYYEHANLEWPPEDKPITTVLKWIGIIFGSILAILAVALLLYTLIKHKEIGFEKGAIMEVVGVVCLILGVTTAVLCDRLL